MTKVVLGWDVGGAHLKLARLGAEGRLEAVRIVPCALWRGPGELDAALDALGGDASAGASSAVTMTGELVDLWPDRAIGVAAIAGRLQDRLGAGSLAFYAGAGGFVGPDQAAERWSEIASANWRATAEALAADEGAGLLVDVGSTTADFVPFAGGQVLARGTDDFGRMAAEELVYLGIVRTPVLAIAPRLPFAGAWIVPMAEHFATAADVFRLTRELRESADLHPAADDGPKTAEASARRLLRMVGADLTPETEPQAVMLARWLAEATLRRLVDAASVVLSRPGAPSAPRVFGAGVGRFLARKLAERLGLMYRDVGEAWADDPGLASAVADCAPAAAVARLFASRR